MAVRATLFYLLSHLDDTAEQGDNRFAKMRSI